VVAALWVGMQISQIRRQMDQLAAPAVTQLYHRALHMCMPNNSEVSVLISTKQMSVQTDSD